MLSLLLVDGARDPSRVGFATRVATPARARASAAASASTGARVIAIAKAAGNPYPERIALGRARNCDVVLRDPSVSKLHACFCLVDAALELTDVGSHNGTRVNGRALLPHRPMRLVVGDLIVFGDVAARLVDAALLRELVA